MKTLIFSSPFGGHTPVLKKLMEENRDLESRLVITGWTNFEVDGATNLGRSELRETDPALWTFPRVNELLGDCLDIAAEYDPNLIIYDFFSFEGNYVGKMLGIPYWCSIPAMMGPNTNGDYLKKKLADQRNVEAIARLRETYGIDVGTPEMISDGLHIPGEVNLIWSYPELTRTDFMAGREKADYQFIGNYNHKVENEKQFVYFSLGTVVMDNLWNQQRNTREAVREFVAEVADQLYDERVVFVTQGKDVLQTYPPRWIVEERVDQVDYLSRSKVFITHGGSNSFHEAVLQGVPMVVIPIFGDQILVGQRVEELGLGINLGTDDSIDTRKSKGFLDGTLAEKTFEAVREILGTDRYHSRMKGLELTHTDLGELLTKYFGNL